MARTRDIFLEYFYYKNIDMLKSELSSYEINQYLNNRSFIRTISAIGQHNLQIVALPVKQAILLNLAF